MFKALDNNLRINELLKNIHLKAVLDIGRIIHDSSNELERLLMS